MTIKLFSVLICFIFVSQSIILVNEESLILICFTAITSIFLSYYSSSFRRSIFTARSDKIKENILLSIQKLNSFLNQIISISNIQILHKDIKGFQSFCLRLIKNFAVWFLMHAWDSIRFFYPSYFRSLQIMESKIIKLIIFSMYFKINRLFVLENFFRTGMKSCKIRGSSLLELREWMSYKKKVNWVRSSTIKN